jgi:hypothetical protein
MGRHARKAIRTKPHEANACNVDTEPHLVKTVGEPMGARSNEKLQVLIIQTDDEKADGVRKAATEATAKRLKTVFREVQKSGATENPEAGCVPWYHFPQAGRQP